MAMTTRSNLPAAEFGVLPDDTDAVVVQTGSGAEPTSVLVAGRDHFRVLDDGRLVLYRRGALIPPEHAEVSAMDAELQDGGYRPKGRKRAGITPPPRDTGQPTEGPRAPAMDTATAAER